MDPQRYAPLPTLSPQAVLEELASRQGFVDGVVITGGEPTIQDDLPDFLREVRGMIVKLDTNGVRPGLGHLYGSDHRSRIWPAAGAVRFFRRRDVCHPLRTLDHDSDPGPDRRCLRRHW